MNLVASDYANLTRNAEWERNLAVSLRAVSEEDRLKFINEFLDYDLVVGLDLAVKCLKEKKSFGSLLERGMKEANPSDIKLWLRCVLPRLGARHLVRYLVAKRGDYPSAFESAKYWLPDLVSPADRPKLDVLAA